MPTRVREGGIARGIIASMSALSPPPPYAVIEREATAST
jgi:hypothetical protein